MMKAVEKERGRKYVGLPEFAQVGARVVSELDLEQERGTVTAVPDERTIRYYLSEGLIQAPDEKHGTASVFGYVHLLQLVVVKKLQAEHLPIRKIRELAAGRDEHELESLLGIGSRSKQTEAKRYLESLLMQAPSAPPMSRASVSRKQEAKASETQNQAEVSWHRVEIEPGFELHIRSDYAPPASSGKTRGLAERIRSVINKWRDTD